MPGLSVSPLLKKLTPITLLYSLSYKPASMRQRKNEEKMLNKNKRRFEAK